jgi:hypothetical protein
MPGIFGILAAEGGAALEEASARAKLSSMELALAHRVDYRSAFWDPPENRGYIGSIGHANLMDPRKGQPEPGGPGRITGLFYGRPNPRKPSGASTSVLSELTVERLLELSGCFSLVFFEPEARRFVIAVDRLASEPVYYLQSGGVLYFAPEVKALKVACDIERQPDFAALAMFLGSGHLLADQTLHASVRKLPGGHALLVDDDGVRITEYWRFSPGPGDESRSKAELADELGEVVSEAVARNLGDPAKTNIFLSGGADSRAILSASLECVAGAGDRLHTVSWGTSPDMPDSDPHVASLIAKAYDINHRFAIRNTCDYGTRFQETNSLLDGMSDIAAFHPQEFSIIEGLRNAGFERVLRGDETFGWKGHVYDIHGAISKVGIRRHFDTIALLPSVMQGDAYRKCVDALEDAVTGMVDGCREMDPNDAKDYLYFNHRLQRYLGSTAYFKQVILDHRNPLLDSKILDFIARIPRKLRLEKTLFMECIRRRYPNLCRFPFARRSALEDWGAELANDSPVREYVAKEIADAASGIWDFFDQDGLFGLLDATRLSDAAVLKGPGAARKYLNKGVRSVLSVAAPRTAEKIVVKREQQRLYGYTIILRFIVLKHWYDTLAR